MCVCKCKLEKVQNITSYTKDSDLDKFTLWIRIILHCGAGLSYTVDPDKFTLRIRHNLPCGS